MLSATLGPGLLGMIYDGLQNPLQALAQRDGFFLVRSKTVALLTRQEMDVCTQPQAGRALARRRRHRHGG
jgi:vacuolar-type H+-ATPase catalytic subunit A/Vma1